MESTNKLKSLINKKYLSVALFIVLDVVFIVFIAYLVYKIYGIYTETRVLEEEIDQMKSSSLLIKNNKDLLQNNITEYNGILDDLIPNDETYFQVISALEQLEARIGVNIESYSINLSETTEEKMSLSLTISGSQESIESFLENYHYYGGRLLTNEEITYMPRETETINFTVNLFHVSSDSTDLGGDPSENIITTKDIEFIKSIQQQL